MSWEPIIGLEVHVQLRTQSKIFSGSPTTYGANPNTQASSIDLALPGTLPVLNKEVVKLAILFGLSVDATIENYSVFARKNYFYPDLPKGYQISQHNYPIVQHGKLPIVLDDDSTKWIGITRAHLEEDAGKSIHECLPDSSGIDLNRAGTPLLEIVSEPDLRSAKEATFYLKALHTLVRYLDISDANMQEGSFRCDVNISLRQAGTTALGTRAEIKNLNSFRFIERAIHAEIKRQTDLLSQGKPIIQETLLYDTARDQTRPMRTKEEAQDYRYFPDPDLLPLTIDPTFIDSIKKQLPELPQEKQKRIETTYQLNRYDAKLITSQLEIAEYFETILKYMPDLSPKLVANWINGDLAAQLNKCHLSFSENPLSPEQLAGLLARITDNTLSGTMAKSVFEAMWDTTDTADHIIETRGLKQITDTGAIEKIIDAVLEKFPTQVKQYQEGQHKLIAFFVGQTMKATQGKANPKQVNELLKSKLESTLN